MGNIIPEGFFNQHNVSVSHIAKLCHISSSTLNKFECGMNNLKAFNPKPETIEKVKTMVEVITKFDITWPKGKETDRILIDEKFLEEYNKALPKVLIIDNIVPESIIEENDDIPQVPEPYETESENVVIEETVDIPQESKKGFFKRMFKK